MPGAVQLAEDDYLAWPYRYFPIGQKLDEKFLTTPMQAGATAVPLRRHRELKHSVIAQRQR